MKLDLLGSSIMLTASIILLAGCKQKSGYERLVSDMSGAKAIKSQYIIHVKGQPDATVDFLFQKPGRFLASSANFTIGSNEADGHIEVSHLEKLYDWTPWDGGIYPGTGKLLPNYLAQGGPAGGKSPKDFAPNYKWISKGIKNGQETYTKTVESMAGPQDYTLVVGTDGKPVKFIGPGVEYEIKSFEVVDEQPIEKFHVEPRDGYVSIRTQMDVLSIATGDKFDWSKFKAAADVANFAPTGDTLFVMIDPSEPTSAGVIEWMKKPGSGYQKVAVTKGQASSGFYDPDGKAIDAITTSTPFFLLVGKDQVVKGLWQGFDGDGIAKFEKDIQLAIEGKN